MSIVLSELVFSRIFFDWEEILVAGICNAVCCTLHRSDIFGIRTSVLPMVGELKIVGLATEVHYLFKD